MGRRRVECIECSPGAMTLMADVKSAKELGSCGMSTIAKAVEVAIVVYDKMLDDVTCAIRTV